MNDTNDTNSGDTSSTGSTDSTSAPATTTNTTTETTIASTETQGVPDSANGGGLTTATVGAEGVAAAAATPAVEEPKLITFQAEGFVKGTVKVPLGTKVKEALKKIQETIAVSTVQLREKLTGASVGIERALSEDMVVTATQKSSGG